MRVLFTSTSGIGHVQPMIPLALASQAQGHDVLFATAHDSCGMIGSTGIATIATGLTTLERMGIYRQRFPEAAHLVGNALPDHMFPHGFGEVAAPRMYADLIGPATDWEPDVIVSEAAELAGPVVAASLGVPNVTHSFGLAIPALRVEKATSFLADTWLANGLEPRPFGGCYDHLYIDIYPESMQPEDLSRLGRIIRRRPESADQMPGHEISSTLNAFLRRTQHDRPLIYVTFGTVFNFNDAFRAVVEATQSFPALFVVTVGPNGDPAAFGTLPNHVHIENYIPQSAILDRCTAVISHGGSGSMLAGLSRGIPQLCIPQGADQFANAAACSAAGVGIAMTENVTAESISTALAQIITNSTFRVAANKVAAEIDAMPSADEVVVALTSLTRPTSRLPSMP
jgi:UDP:flavonoid glycosyltransferase YjiC (YdhE family)